MKLEEHLGLVRRILARVDFNRQGIPEVHELLEQADAAVAAAQRELRHLEQLLAYREYATARRELVE